MNFVGRGICNGNKTAQKIRVLIVASMILIPLSAPVAAGTVFRRTPLVKSSAQATRIDAVNAEPLSCFDPRVNHGIQGWVRIGGGTGAFAALSPGNRIIEVGSASQLNGTVRLMIILRQGRRPSADTSFILAPSWGDQATTSWSVSSRSPQSHFAFSVPVQLTASAEGGLYYIIFALRDETNGAAEAPVTGATAGRATLSDQNDVARLKPEQIAISQRVGCVVDRLLTQGGLQLVALPSDAITVKVVPPHFRSLGSNRPGLGNPDGERGGAQVSWTFYLTGIIRGFFYFFVACVSSVISVALFVGAFWILVKILGLEGIAGSSPFGNFIAGVAILAVIIALYFAFGSYQDALVASKPWALLFAAFYEKLIFVVIGAWVVLNICFFALVLLGKRFGLVFVTLLGLTGVGWLINRHAKNQHEGCHNDTGVISYADFSRPAISSCNMDVKPITGFAFNDGFPESGTWRITAWGGGFTSTFAVPTGGQYSLLVAGGSSYDDSHHMPGYSPIMIQLNSQLIVTSYNSALSNGKVAGGTANRWPIVAQAGQNTLRFTLGNGATTHFWIHRIEIEAVQ